MPEWNQKRSPEDVPTPIAVAVSDFCRRAGSPAAPSEVREALALLAEDEDFRVRAVTDSEPSASPLGPFAVVDLIRGTEPPLAAERQRCGYYEVVRALVVEQQRTTPPPAPPAAAVAAPTLALAPNRPAVRAVEPHEQSMAQKIAPKKRAPVAAVPDAEGEPAPTDEQPLEAESYTFKRHLPAPRGRFTRLPSTRHPISMLRQPEAKEVLQGLIEQHAHRYALLQAVDDQYVGRGGAPMGIAELMGIITDHGLMAHLQSREQTLLLSQFTEHRGAAGRVAWALGVSPSDLERLVQEAGVSREVDELRDRFKREALQPKNFGYRLDLVGRTKYLADLGIVRRSERDDPRVLRGR
jgi:hypothetical protein